jgi:carboxylesterase
MCISTQEQTFQIGEGRVGILLLHSLGGTPAELRYVASGLARSGYKVLCPQIAGHCGTEADLSATRWQDWLASAEAALETLAAECDFVIAGGQSTGAVLALMLAARRPEIVAATTLLSPTLVGNGAGIPWYAGLFHAIRVRALARLFRFRLAEGVKDPRVREFLKAARAKGDSAGAGLAATPGSAVIEHRRLVAAVSPLLGRITQPALVLHSREDDVAHLDNAWRLQARLAGPVDVTVLEDCFHMISIDRQRHVVLDRMTTFLARVTSRPKARFVRAAETTAPVLAPAPAALVA